MRRREFIKAALVAPIIGVTSPKPAGARISVEKGNPGYDSQWLMVEKIKVLCDGKEIDCVITADSRKGYVKYYDMNLNRVVRELHGKVEIKINGRHYNDRHKQI